jgi:DNA-binding MarR family transcriptional regulator
MTKPGALSFTDPLEQLNRENTLAFDMFVTFKVNRLSTAFERQWTRFMREEVGLSLAEWRVVATLSGVEHKTFAQVVQAIGMNKSLCSRCLATLQQQNLVASEVTPGDSRSLTLSLTARGRQLVTKLKPAVLRRQRMLLESLTRQERQILYAALDKLHGAAANWEDLEDNH